MTKSEKDWRCFLLETKIYFQLKHIFKQTGCTKASGAPQYILTPAHSFNPREDGTMLKNILWEEGVGFGRSPKRRGQGGGQTHKYAGGEQVSQTNVIYRVYVPYGADR